MAYGHGGGMVMVLGDTGTWGGMVSGYMGVGMGMVSGDMMMEW